MMGLLDCVTLIQCFRQLVLMVFEHDGCRI